MEAQPAATKLMSAEIAAEDRHGAAGKSRAFCPRSTE